MRIFTIVDDKKGPVDVRANTITGAISNLYGRLDWIWIDEDIVGIYNPVARKYEQLAEIHSRIGRE